MTAIDLARARAETRGCEERNHLNHAGASLMPAPVMDALLDYLRSEERIGGYETADRYRDVLENFYDASARLLGCQRDEVAFIENATRAWDMAFYAMDLAPGDRILTSVAEYGSNVIAYLHRAKRTGVEVEFVPDDAHGQLDVAALERAIDVRVKLIAVTHIPTANGLINPAAAIGRVARAAGVPFLLDACQSVGQIPVDVSELGCDMLSATGRKFLRGPRGTGLLYVRRAWIERLDPPMLDQHAAVLIDKNTYRVRADARRFENWECNFPGKAALGRAIDYGHQWGAEAIRDRVFGLADRLRAGLSEIAGVQVMDRGQLKCGIVTFQVDGTEPEAVKQRLAAKGINVSASDTSGNRVLFDQLGVAGVVRASVHYCTSEEEVDQAVREVHQLASA